MTKRASWARRAAAVGTAGVLTLGLAGMQPVHAAAQPLGGAAPSNPH